MGFGAGLAVALIVLGLIAYKVVSAISETDGYALKPEKWTTVEVMGKDLARVTDVCAERELNDIVIDSGNVGMCTSDSQVGIVYVNTARGARDVEISASQWGENVFAGGGMAVGDKWGVFCAPTEPSLDAEQRAQDTCRHIARLTPDGAYLKAY